MNSIFTRNSGKQMFSASDDAILILAVASTLAVAAGLAVAMRASTNKKVDAKEVESEVVEVSPIQQDETLPLDEDVHSEEEVEESLAQTESEKLLPSVQVSDEPAVDAQKMTELPKLEGASSLPHTHKPFSEDQSTTSMQTDETSKEGTDVVVAKKKSKIRRSLRALFPRKKAKDKSQ